MFWPHKLKKPTIFGLPDDAKGTVPVDGRDKGGQKEGAASRTYSEYKCTPGYATHFTFHMPADKEIHAGIV